MIINDISRNKLVRYFSGPSDTSDTSNTANSSDASKTSASVTRLSSYFVLYLSCIFKYRQKNHYNLASEFLKS